MSVATKKQKNDSKLSAELSGALSQLVEASKGVGSVSEDDIQVALRDIDVDDDELEDLYGALRSKGVEVVSSEEDAGVDACGDD